MIGQHLGIADLDVLGHHLLAQDRDPCFQIRRLHVGDQSPLETGAQTRFQRCQLVRWPVGRQHDLLPGLVQAVERVEKLLLQAFLALDELDVVDHQQVVCAVALLEVDHASIPHGIDELVQNGLGCDVAHVQPRMLLKHVMADRLQQVGFPQPGAAMDEKWVVRLGRRLGHGQRRGVRETVARADHEHVERVLGVDAGGGCDRRRQPRPRPVAAAGASTASPMSASRACGDRLGHRHPQFDHELVFGCGRVQQAGEVALDPAEGELVGDGHHQPVAPPARAPERFRTRWYRCPRSTSAGGAGRSSPSWCWRRGHGASNGESNAARGAGTTASAYRHRTPSIVRYLQGFARFPPQPSTDVETASHTSPPASKRPACGRVAGRIRPPLAAPFSTAKFFSQWPPRRAGAVVGKAALY